jgi:hypothetical protein
MKKNITITEAELFTELNKLRSVPKWTPQMDAVILKAREGDNQVSWVKLERFLKEKFGVSKARTSIRERHLQLTKEK